MNRQQKSDVVEALKYDFEKSKASFLVGYKGMTVAQVLKLRKQLHQESGTFKVAKVTLIKRVASTTPSVERLMPLLKDQVALVFALNESPIVARVLYNFAKEHQQLTIIGGCMDAQFLDKESIKTLALLPSKSVLLSQILGVLQLPSYKLVATLNMVVLRLLLVLKKIEEKKSANL